MNLRKTVAAAAIAGAAVFGLAACNNGQEPTSVPGTTPSVITESNAAAVVALTAPEAQVIVRKAVDPATGATEIDAVVDTTNTATKLALLAFAKGASMGGYTPDVFTVKTVKVDGSTAVATVSVKSPHAPQPVDISLSYVNVDGKWKLSSDAVTQLTSLASGH